MSGGGEPYRKAGEGLRPLPNTRQSWARLKALKHIIVEGEETLLECLQSKVHSFSPASILATTKRLIIVKPSFWAVHAGRRIFSPTKYNVIPYKRLARVSISKGTFLSTLSIWVRDPEEQSLVRRIEIRGVRTAEAERLTTLLDGMLENSGTADFAENRIAEAIRSYAV